MDFNKYLENQNETMGENSFMKTLLKKRLNQKGLTLIELLAVIVILAIVAAIAIPAIGGIIANSRDKAVLADASAIISGAKLANTAGECDLTSPATGNECNQANLGEYVDGVTGNYSVVDNGTDLVVTFPDLARTWNINPAPVTTGTGATTAITETALNTALNGNN